MTAKHAAETERLAKAIDRLNQLVDATVDSGEISTELTRVALLMVAPVTRILRNDRRLFRDLGEEQAEKVLSAYIRSGDSALVDAILEA